jgi:hypothetical protein
MIVASAIVQLVLLGTLACFTVLTYSVLLAQLRQDTKSTDPRHRSLMVEIEHDGVRRSVWLAGKRLRIGRSPDNDIIVNAPGISRHHVLLFKRWGRCYVSNLSTTNGTFLVTGQPVVGTARLGVSDHLVLGSTNGHGIHVSLRRS